MEKHSRYLLSSSITPISEKLWSIFSNFLYVRSPLAFLMKWAKGDLSFETKTTFPLPSSMSEVNANLIAAKLV